MNREMWALLQSACVKRCTLRLEELLEQISAERLAQVRDTKRRTVLMYAVVWDFNELVCLMLEHEADVLATDKCGKDSLHLAAASGSAGALRLLLRHVSTPVPYHSLIAEACAHDRSEVLSTLFCQMRIPAAKYSDTQLRSLLHVAASHGATDCVEYGLQHGVDPNDKDLDGRTPLYYACEILDETVAAALLRGGADPTIRNDDGCLAWHVRYVDLDDLQEMLNSIVEQLQLDTNKLPSPKLCPCESSSNPALFQLGASLMPSPPSSVSEGEPTPV